MWAIRYFTILPNASLLQYIPNTSSDNPLECLLKGFKALTQANFGSSVFVLGMINIEQSSICCHTPLPSAKSCHYFYLHGTYYTSIKIIKNEVGCRDDTVPKTVDTRRHCEEE